MKIVKLVSIAVWIFCSTANAQTQIFDNGAGLASVRGSPILEIIRDSRELSIEIYQINDPEVKQALREAIQRGVKVRLVIEPKPVGGDKNDEIGEMRKILGHNLQLFNKAHCGQQSGSSASCFQHGKLILSTGSNGEKVALMSTGNFNPTNLCNMSENPARCNRDYTVVTRDPNNFKLLSEIFEADFKGQRYDLKALLNKHPEASKQLTVSPFSKKPLVKFVEGAKPGCRMQVENQYMKDPELTDAIMAAGKRGVDVEMTLASPCAFSALKDTHVEAGKKLAARARANRVKLKFFTKEQEIHGLDGYMHAKAIVISGCSDGSPDRSWVGSVNGSTTSLDLNREFGLIVQEKPVAKFLSDIMNWDHNDKDSASWNEIIGDGSNSCPIANQVAER